MKTNVVVTVKSWNIANFKRLKGQYPDFDWVLITDKDELTKEKLEELDPEYVFFTHWAWIIKEDIYENFNCVVFHMTDLPFGRGGSPLQNLISRGIEKTKLSAIKVVGGIDAGPIYMKVPLDLNGSAEEIYKRASDIVYGLIPRIAKEKPEPKEQEGEVIEFKRRTPDMSKIPMDGSLEKVYDWIRMLDAEGYPPAFIDYGYFRLIFKKARKEGGTVRAEVVFERRDEDE